jgi:prophage tail gpP-like protein
VNHEVQDERSSSKVPVVAILLGAIAAFITAGVVSWSTPDGNLVVTSVPALAVGLTVFGLASWRVRRGRSKRPKRIRP